MSQTGDWIGGRYALGELLGVGGTGSVFAAVDHGSDGAAGPDAAVDVAIKLLHPHLCADDASRDAFLREASHMIGLQPPNIVGGHAAGLHDAGGVIMPWIALDLLHGPTLREWVDVVGRLPAADAAAVAEGMLAGLGAAHRAGIVHRDVSPQNVILHGAGERAAGAPLTAGMVRVVDFGLADVTGHATLGSDVLLARVPGAEAGVVGNASFMSPEQAQGRPVRAVSDLYQAGAVLYFALTARAPFPRGTTEQVLRAHIAAPPPVPSALAPGARVLDRVVTRAMAKNPLRRYRDAADFAESLTGAVALLRSAEAVPADAAADADIATDADVAADADVAEARTSATWLLPAAAAAPLDYLSPAAAAPAARDTPVRSGGGIAAGVATVVILGLAGWAVVAAAASPSAPAPEPTVAAPTSSAPAETTAPGPSAPPPATASAPPPPLETVQATVPALHGSLADAEAALRAAGLVLGAVARIESPETADRVLAQHPAPGSGAAPGDAVAVTVASGSNVVPQVSGMTYAAAVAMIESSGFVSSGEPPAQPAIATVIGTQPGAGAVLRVGVAVALVPTPISATPDPTEPIPDPTGDQP